MEFLVIMAVGTAVAVWAVIGTRPKQGAHFVDDGVPPEEFTPHETPAWKKDIAQSHPIGELEYLEGIERYENDPAHQPFPLPPPRHEREDRCD